MSGPSKTPIRFWYQMPWSLLFSLKAGVILLAILIVASGLGTLIEDLDEAVEKVFASPWYLFLLGLLAVNITCSTVRMVYERILHRPPPPLQTTARSYEVRKPSVSVSSSASLAEIAGEMRKIGFELRQEGDAGVAWKGRSGLWGAVIAHLGLVMVLFAGMLAGLLIQGGNITLGEGESTRSAVSEKDENTLLQLGFTVVCDDFHTEFHPRSGIRASFISTLSLPDVEPPIWARDVLVNVPLTVNGWTFYQMSWSPDPGVRRFVLEGLGRTFELSPGQTRKFEHEGEIVTVSLGSGFPYPWRLEQPGAAPGEGVLFDSEKTLRLRLDRFEPDLYVDESGQVGSRTPEARNPALLVALLEGDTVKEQRWLFYDEATAREMNRRQMMRPESLPVMASFRGVKGTAFMVEVYRMDNPPDAEGAAQVALELGESAVISPAAGEQAPEGQIQWKAFSQGSITYLRVARNPMLGIIYAGCVLMMAGLVWSFMIPRSTVWFWKDAESGKWYFAGRYRYAREHFDRRVNRIIEACAEQSDTSRSQEDI